MRGCNCAQTQICVLQILALPLTGGVALNTSVPSHLGAEYESISEIPQQAGEIAILVAISQMRKWRLKEATLYKISGPAL